MTGPLGGSEGGAGIWGAPFEAFERGASADEPAPNGLPGWHVLELMGHRKIAGYVRETTVAGAGMLRIDVPGEGDDVYATQLYPPGSVYCMTPVTEELARRFAEREKPRPVTRYELPQAQPNPLPEQHDFLAEDDDPDDGDPF